MSSSCLHVTGCLRLRLRNSWQVVQGVKVTHERGQGIGTLHQTQAGGPNKSAPPPSNDPQETHFKPHPVLTPCPPPCLMSLPRLSRCTSHASARLVWIWSAVLMALVSWLICPDLSFSCVKHSASSATSNVEFTQQGTRLNAPVFFPIVSPQ